MKKLLTINQVAAVLGISVKTVRRLVKCGALDTPTPVGGSARWHQDAIRDYLAWARIQARMKLCQEQP
jgi:excisionase family DNA binding protein